MLLGRWFMGCCSVYVYELACASSYIVLCEATCYWSFLAGCFAIW